MSHALQSADMNFRVTCWEAGKVFNVDRHAANYPGLEVARVQHPNARIPSVNAVFQ